MLSRQEEVHLASGKDTCCWKEKEVVSGSGTQWQWGQRVDVDGWGLGGTRQKSSPGCNLGVDKDSSDLNGSVLPVWAWVNGEAQYFIWCNDNGIVEHDREGNSPSQDGEAHLKDVHDLMDHQTNREGKHRNSDRGEGWRGRGSMTRVVRVTRS